jgi:hypothetical protein
MIDQKDSSYTLHVIEEGDKVVVVAIDDKTNYQFRGEYDSPSVAVLEGIIALTQNRMKEGKENALSTT